MTPRFLPARLFVLLGLIATAQARTVTDSAGRVVEILDEVTRVFAAGPPASILVYALKPEALLGWPRALRDYEKPYIAEPYRELAETGRLTGRGGGANLERVLALKPDLIVDFGSVRDTYIDLADRVLEQTGFPLHPGERPVRAHRGLAASRRRGARRARPRRGAGRRRGGDLRRA